ncbi:MAG: triose-phosphate isomerase [Desulfovibrio sp.]|nr:triose-phosphate isomerase [Desulfovibrio sp.]
MQKIIAANWKMYKTRAQAAQSAASLAAGLRTVPAERCVLVFAPFTCLDVVAQAFAQNPALACGGQDCYPADEGAFTGEISPAMLLDCGATWALTGHSERRHILGEDDALVARKTIFALEKGLNVMLCIGEKLEEREAGNLSAVLERQIHSVFEAMPEGQSLDGRFAVAYEPVWAIGTGKVAGHAEVLEAHAVVRTLLQGVLGNAAERLPILYGGSVKPANAAGILALDNVDGLLVGGASLDAQSFLQIVGV